MKQILAFLVILCLLSTGAMAAAGTLTRPVMDWHKVVYRNGSVQNTTAPQQGQVDCVKYPDHISCKISQAPTIDCATTVDHTDCIVEYLNRSVIEVPKPVQCSKGDCMLNQSVGKVFCATYRNTSTATGYTDCYVEYDNKTLKYQPGVIICNNDVCIHYQKAPVSCAKYPDHIACLLTKAPDVRGVGEKVGILRKVWNYFFQPQVLTSQQS